MGYLLRLELVMEGCCYFNARAAGFTAWLVTVMGRGNEEEAFCLEASQRIILAEEGFAGVGVRELCRVLPRLELHLAVRTAPAPLPASATGHSPHLLQRASHADQSLCILPRTQVELKVNYIKVVSRAAVLPFEIVDAARSEVRRHRLEGTW